MTMTTTRAGIIPGDLMTASEVARKLNRKYTSVMYHLNAAKLLRWERGAKRLCSYAEVRAYFDEWERIRPIGEDEEGEGEEQDT